MRYSVITLALAMCTFPSCNSDGFEPLEYQVFEEVLFERKVNFQDMIDDVMKHYGESAGGFEEFEALQEKVRKLAKEYTIYGIRYKTSDHEGKPISASGLVYFPESFRKRGVLEIIPVTKSRGSCGTVNRSIPEAVAGCTGYVMIIPDLPGCGITDDYAICYLQHDLIASVAADMRKAASEFLWNRRRHLLGNQDYLFGYSLGGSGVLALARHYVKHPELGVKVRELWLGAGAYFPRQALEKILEAKTVNYAICPNILYSLDWYEKLGIDFREVFTGELKEHYEELVTGDVPIDTLSKWFGPSLENYMNMDFFDDGSEGWRKIRSSLETKDIPIDFKPSFPVYLYQSYDDKTIPHALSDSLNARLTRVGANVSYKKTTGTHHNTGFMIEGDLAEHLAL